jgi:hypothetical protein
LTHVEEEIYPKNKRALESEDEVFVEMSLRVSCTGIVMIAEVDELDTNPLFAALEV